MRILLVDDELAVLRALARLFGRRGHEVRTVASAEAALPLLEQFLPDVVISDFKMGGMTGVDLLRVVKRRLPNARRVLLSGYAEVDGAFDAIFIHKPYSSQDLLRVCE